MPERNKKQGFQKKKGGTEGEILRVRTPRRGQVLGEVEQLLGDRRMLVKCTDGHKRMCRIPGKIRKRIWLKEGTIVLIEPWQIQSNEKGDILWRYSNQEANWLEKSGFLRNLFV